MSHWLWDTIFIAIYDITLMMTAKSKFFMEATKDHCQMKVLSLQYAGMFVLVTHKQSGSLWFIGIYEKASRSPFQDSFQLHFCTVKWLLPQTTKSEMPTLVCKNQGQKCVF